MTRYLYALLETHGNNCTANDSSAMDFVCISFVLVSLKSYQRASRSLHIQYRCVFRLSRAADHEAFKERIGTRSWTTHVLEFHSL
jgi:hypothetical protein